MPTISLVQRKHRLFRKLVEVDKMAERNIHRMRSTETHEQVKDNNLYHV